MECDAPTEAERVEHADPERLQIAREYVRQQCPICQGFLPDERNGGDFACPKCGTEFSL